MDCSVCLAAIFTTRSLHLSTNFPIPYSSMSFFPLLKPNSFSTSRSIHRPCVSKPFCRLISYPCMACHRKYKSFRVLPHAWCTPIGLFVVMGPSMNDHLFLEFL